MSYEPFSDIGQHWSHFLERDIPVNAPDVQVSEMRRAFAAGAISGLQLGMLAKGDKETIEMHMKEIVSLV